ncbi:MAG: pentapeptide repeat-containing protein [Desulfobacterales bacterium]
MRGLGRCLVVMFAFALPLVAAAFNPSDVERLEAGENDLRNADFIGLERLRRMDVSGVDFRGADFSNCRLWSVVFDRAKLDGAKLENGSFHGAHFNMAVLKNANLKGADMTITPCGAADFSGADLSGARFGGAVLNFANFNKARLSGADFTRARFYRADLTGADLSGAVFQDADFDSTRVDSRWQAYLQGQGVRNFEKIEWVQPAPVKPADLARPKVDKEPLKPGIPVKK